VTKSAAVAVARTGTADVDPAVTRFLDGAWMERGLSANTLAAYRADLMALSRWLATQNVLITKATRGDVLGFIAFRVEKGARPRSTARQLSSFRRFFRHLLREGSLRDDPTAQIAMPKIGRSLPKSL
jgi:integrase/recombinase XerD